MKNEMDSSLKSEIILYQPNGTVSLEVRLDEDTVWLSQAQMAELFQTTKQNVSLHINNIFKENELDKNSVVKDYLTTALDGKAYKKHKDALANFNREYVKTEVFPRNIGRRISEAAEIRHASDYDDFYIATKIEAEEQIATAEELLDLVQKYCNERLNG